MAHKRKTKAQRKQERDDADRRAWDVFRPRLEALETYVDAKLLMAEAPRPDAPGRRYYSNLAFFLQTLVVPADSTYEERALYLRFIQRLDAAAATPLDRGGLAGQDARAEHGAARRPVGNGTA